MHEETLTRPLHCRTYLLRGLLREKILREKRGRVTFAHADGSEGQNQINKMFWSPCEKVYGLARGKRHKPCAESQLQNIRQDTNQ